MTTPKHAMLLKAVIDALVEDHQLVPEQTYQFDFKFMKGRDPNAVYISDMVLSVVPGAPYGVPPERSARYVLITGPLSSDPLTDNATFETGLKGWSND